MTKDNIPSQRFDLDIFLEVLGYYSVGLIEPGAYSNEDMQRYIFPGIFSVRIWDYESGYEKEWHVSRPKTLDAAINDFLLKAFPDSECTEEEKEDIRNEYQAKLNGLTKRDEVSLHPTIGLRVSANR